MICEWCGREFQRASHRGPTPKFCSHAHRQAAHRARHSKHKIRDRVWALIWAVLTGFALTVAIGSAINGSWLFTIADLAVVGASGYAAWTASTPRRAP